VSVVDVALRPARADEAPALSELALRSKAHWGYDDAFLEACRAELTVRPEHVAASRVVVATSAARVVGFSILLGGPPRADLRHGPGHGSDDVRARRPDHDGTIRGLNGFAALPRPGFTGRNQQLPE